jgi:hypothetical protein
MELGMAVRAIARSCDLSPSTVLGYIGRAKVAKLEWPLPSELDDDEALTRLLFPDERSAQPNRPEPDWARIHIELKKKHVTKQLLWEEYKAEHPDGNQYSQFCDRTAGSGDGDGDDAADSPRRREDVRRLQRRWAGDR